MLRRRAVHPHRDEILEVRQSLGRTLDRRAVGEVGAVAAGEAHPGGHAGLLEELAEGLDLDEAGDRLGRGAGAVREELEALAVEVHERRAADAVAPYSEPSARYAP